MTGDDYNKCIGSYHFQQMNGLHDKQMRKRTQLEVPPFAFAYKQDMLVRGIS